MASIAKNLVHIAIKQYIFNLPLSRLSTKNQPS